ncbi:hypothetical protein KIN20_036794 [Parelaphostrongylus tenuis]|uniref:Major facilitator superfamily (MFS) profile domain-containing protein n=1 Tax=Parelaphostrongylus tenuis TaxID=148309 RepID=A0AAD5RDB7_PARTN|nr:hypothetical protein KIN20_036794 [Parelaphostrongylus tenuis]
MEEQVLMFSTPLAGFSHVVGSPELFVISRLFSGIGVGMGTTAQGVFLAEISPVAYRGVISSFGGFATNIGFIFASALGLPGAFGKKMSWPYAFYIESVPCIDVHEEEKSLKWNGERKGPVESNLMDPNSERNCGTNIKILVVTNMAWFHDSPVFLLHSGNEAKSHQALVAYCRSDGARYEMQRVVDEVKSYKTNVDVVWDRAARRALKLSLTLNVIVSFSGILAVSFFGTSLLQSIGFTERSASLANCLSGLSGTLGAVVSTFAVDRIGRRALVLGSLLLLAAVNTLMMILVYYFNTTKQSWTGWAFLLLFIVFLFIFSAGIGPTAWFLGAELAPAGCRPRMQFMSVAAQYVSCFLSPIVYYPLHSSVGALSFFVFIIPLILAAFYFYRYLPETKGRTTAEITAMLNENTSLSK